MTWLIRLLWLTLPITLGDLLADATRRPHRPGGGRGRRVLAWALWAGGSALAAWSGRPGRWSHCASCCTAGRASPASPPRSRPHPGCSGWVGLATRGGRHGAPRCRPRWATSSSTVRPTATSERFPLRPPAVLLLGPIAAGVGAHRASPCPAAALALASRAVGPREPSSAAAGAAAAWWGVRVLARLTRRWCVFVPAGITLVDDMALAEPTLMRSGDIVAVGPAPADTDALDLSAGATGLIVQMDLRAGGLRPGRAAEARCRPRRCRLDVGAHRAVTTRRAACAHAGSDASGPGSRRRRERSVGARSRHRRRPASTRAVGGRRRPGRAPRSDPARPGAAARPPQRRRSRRDRGPPWPQRVGRARSTGPAPRRRPAASAHTRSASTTSSSSRSGSGADGDRARSRRRRRSRTGGPLPPASSRPRRWPMVTSSTAATWPTLAARRRPRSAPGAARRPAARNAARPSLRVMKHTSWLSGLAAGAQSQRRPRAGAPRPWSSRRSGSSTRSSSAAVSG